MPIPAGPGAPAPSTGALTLTYDDQLSRVRITAAGIPSSDTLAVIERSTNQINWVTVRGGGALVPSGGVTALDDYEFVPDVVNYYRVRVWTSGDREIGPALNANPYLETDASGWTGTNATVARSTTQAHEGAASLLITPNGSSATGGADATARVGVTAGTDYLAALRARTTATVTLAPAVDWYTALTGGTLVSTGLVTGAPIPAGAWSSVSGTLTAPVGAVGAVMRARHSGTPTTAWWADEIGLHKLDDGPLLTGSITPAIGGVWIKSVTRPFLNRQVVVQDYSDITRASRAGVFDIVGRSLPVVVGDVRGSRQWTLFLLAATLDEAATLDLVLASGDVLYIQVPADCDVPGGYVSVGDTNERRPARRSPRRIVSLPCTEVAPPAADVVGNTVTWQTVLNAYPTWADLMLAQPTWADLMELLGAPGDVIVE